MKKQSDYVTKGTLDILGIKEPFTDVAPSTQKGAKAPNVAEPTPTPWLRYGTVIYCRSRENGSRPEPCIAVTSRVDFRLAFNLPKEEAEANAKFIVRAVNSHKELLAACNKALAGIRDTDAEHIWINAPQEPSIGLGELLESAVALAERKP